MGQWSKFKKLIEKYITIYGRFMNTLQFVFKSLPKFELRMVTSELKFWVLNFEYPRKCNFYQYAQIVCWMIKRERTLKILNKSFLAQKRYKFDSRVKWWKINIFYFSINGKYFHQMVFIHVSWQSSNMNSSRLGRRWTPFSLFWRWWPKDRIKNYDKYRIILNMYIV